MLKFILVFSLLLILIFNPFISTKANKNFGWLDIVDLSNNFQPIELDSELDYFASHIVLANSSLDTQPFLHNCTVKNSNYESCLFDKFLDDSFNESLRQIQTETETKRQPSTTYKKLEVKTDCVIMYNSAIFGDKLFKTIYNKECSILNLKETLDLCDAVQLNPNTSKPCYLQSCEYTVINQYKNSDYTCSVVTN